MELTTEALWHRYRDELYAFIAARVSDPHVAEDLLQETFARAHRGLPSIRHPDKVLSWLYRIARNTVTDHYRRRQAVDPLPDSLPVEEGPRATIYDDLRSYLPRLLEELPPIYEEAVRLTELEGYTQKELARQADISLSGAKSRVQRARKKLHELFLSCCDFEFNRYGSLVDCACTSD